MIPCAEIVSRASIINTWKILGDYQVFVENTRESLLTLGSVADSSSDLGPGRVGRAARQRDVTRPKSLPHSGLRSPLLSCVAHGMYVAALTFFFRSFLLSTYSSADEYMSLFPSSARSTPTCPVPAAAARVPPHHRRPLPEGVAPHLWSNSGQRSAYSFACRCRIWSSIYVRSLQESKAHMW